MRKLTYWICFALAAFGAVYVHVGLALSLFGIHWPFVTLLSLLAAFSKLTPQLLTPFVPAAVVTVVDFLMLLLVVRRLWLMLARRQGVPDSYVGLVKVLGYVGAWSFFLAAVGLALSVLLHVGSGVPAAMLGWPALFCVPWAFALAEVLGIRGGKHAT